MKLQLTTAPATEPVTSAMMEGQLGLNSGDDAAKITRDISAARRLAENFTERAFINQSWTLTLDRFPSKTLRNPKQTIFLPKGKTQSITSFTYQDSDDDTITLVSGTDYYLENIGDVARLIPVEYWPETFDKLGTVTIVYVAGYGTSLTSEYNDIIDSIILWATDLYETRQMQVEASGRANYKNEAFEMLLHPYKIYFDFSINDQ